MKKLICLSIIGIASLFFACEAAAQQDKEAESARVPLDNYLQGHITGDPEFIRRAFHKDARIMAFREGKLLDWGVEEYATRFNGKPAVDEARRKRKIESIDISGTAAVVKITLDYPTVRFVDYMSLLKINGEWKIVNKSFYAEPKEQP